jgi:hypothetical protein
MGNSVTRSFRPRATVALVAAFAVSVFAVLWFVLPLARRRTRFPS